MDKEPKQAASDQPRAQPVCTPSIEENNAQSLVSLEEGPHQRKQTHLAPFQRGGQQSGPAAVCRQDFSNVAVMLHTAIAQTNDDAQTMPAATPPEAAGNAGSDKQSASPSTGCQGKSKGKGLYPFGNYHHYYGYRLSNAFEEDPRLKVLRSQWFEGATVLDVGCNEGLVTIALAAKFRCRRVLGLDIDSHLIGRAKHNLARERSAVQAVIRDRTRPANHRRTAGHHMDALRNVTFQQADFVHMPFPPIGSYDAVLAFSITKWVHLNWGDEGLREFFQRLCGALKEGAVLVMEPQPWKSYLAARTKKTTAGPHSRLSDLVLRPDDFVSHLETHHHMKLEHTLQTTGARKGFGRPVLILRKAVQPS